MKLEFVPIHKQIVLKVLEAQPTKFGVPIEVGYLPWWSTNPVEYSSDGKVRFKFHEGSFYIYMSDIDFDWTK
jgi:hypothetical protein